MSSFNLAALSSELDTLIEPIRLVIWDLDETYWKGTLSEGGIEHVTEHERIVIELAHRGIVSSICSKNDASEVDGCFDGHEVSDYWVLSTVDWSAKGPRLRALVEASKLRPESILFIDDNHLMRQEAKHFVPGLQVAAETVISLMLDHPMFRGSPDPELRRLSQYKVLATRQANKSSAGGSAEDFLRESQIVVEIDHDVEQHLDRAIELVNRTNQLNFTKNRLPDDIVAARADLRRVLGYYNIQSGLVKVRDKYGDYGIVGFYVEEKSVHPGSHLYQFCFSCRILGMKVETWLYRMLGRPPVGIAANVTSDILEEDTIIDWISFGHTDTAATAASKRSMDKKTFLLRGGCEVMPLEHYCEQGAEITISELAYNLEGVQQRIEHSQFARYAIDPAPAEAMASFKMLGYRDEDFQTKVFSNAYPDGVRICTFWSDYGYRLYRHKRTGAVIPFSAFPATSMHQDLTKFSVEQLPEQYRHHWVAGALRHLSEEYEDAGLISEEHYKDNLRLLLREVTRTSLVFVIGVHEYGAVDAAGTRPLRQWLRDFNDKTLDVCAEFANVIFIAASDYLIDPTDTDPNDATHFHRIVYHRIFKLISGRLHERKDA